MQRKSRSLCQMVYQVPRSTSNTQKRFSWSVRNTSVPQSVGPRRCFGSRSCQIRITRIRPQPGCRVVRKARLWRTNMLLNSPHLVHSDRSDREALPRAQFLALCETRCQASRRWSELPKLIPQERGRGHSSAADVGRTRGAHVSGVRCPSLLAPGGLE